MDATTMNEIDLLTESPAKQHDDPLLRNVRPFPSVPGLSAIDEARRTPGPQIRRTYITGHGRDRQRDLQVERGVLLCPGAAVGIGSDGLTRHIRPWNKDLRFAGFVVAWRDEEQVVVKTKGVAVLRIRNIELMCEGREVFATEPNEFILGPVPPDVLAAKVGVLIHREGGSPDRCQVAFAGCDEPAWSADELQVVGFRNFRERR